MQKKERNDENIAAVTKVLFGAGYRCGHTMHGSNGEIEFFVGPGSEPVIALQYYKDDNGFEVWVPITKSNRMEVTLDALRRATGLEFMEALK